MKKLIYNPDPEPVLEPLFERHSLDEVEWSDLYEVTCNGEKQAVFYTDSFHYAPVAVGGENDGIDVEIVISRPFEQVKIRPSSYGIEFHREGQKLRFHLPKIMKVSVELDGNLKNPLFVLCSPKIEKPKNTTICFERGKVYNVATLELHDNDVVYLEEGSVVYGRIYAYRCKNIQIIGNGILNGSPWHLPDSNGKLFLVDLQWCENVRIEGITVVDSPMWQIVPAACDHVVIRNTNSLSRVVTGDGIDITGCQDVLIEDCFVRAADDCICIKSGRLPNPTTVRDVKDLIVQRCVLWNAEPGNAIEIGYGIMCKEITNLIFRDCDIIHCEYEGNMGGSAMSIHQADNAYIHDIHYENIRVEDVAQKLFDIKVLECKYTWAPVRGRIEDIYFKDIKVLNGPFPVSIIRGYEMRLEESRPERIYFDNIEILGQKCNSVLDMHMVVELAHKIYVNGSMEYPRNCF